MARFFPEIHGEHAELLRRAPVFFVATADSTGRVNLSPKGHGCLRVLGPTRIVWADHVGSGSETRTHLRANGRITMSFDDGPLINRVQNPFSDANS